MQIWRKRAGEMENPVGYEVVLVIWKFRAESFAHFFGVPADTAARYGEWGGVERDGESARNQFVSTNIGLSERLQD